MSDERRHALGIPVHADDEHEWRSDGYCNCGAERRPKKRRHYLSTRDGGTRARTNLDYIEGNEDNR